MSSIFYSALGFNGYIPQLLQYELVVLVTFGEYLFVFYCLVNGTTGFAAVFAISESAVVGSFGNLRKTIEYLFITGVPQTKLTYTGRID